MGKYVEEAGRTVGVIIDADTAFDPATFNVSVSGRLTKVIVVPGGVAATSLIESGHIKLQCATFKGVDMYAPFQGIGLETVPRDMKPTCVTECDLAVDSGKPIRLFYYHNVLPVTPEIVVYVEVTTGGI